MNENINDSEKLKLENYLEELQVNYADAEQAAKETGQKQAKAQREHDKAKVELDRLKTGYDETDADYLEYLKQLKLFDDFRLLRKKGSTQLANRFATVRIWGTDYTADRSLPRVFLRSMLTVLTNFDKPDVAKINNAFNNRTGNLALKTNTGTATSPTKHSAQWVVNKWDEYLNYRNKMIAIGNRADIVSKAEVVMTSAIPVRNVANYISANPYTRSHIDNILFGSESFIPYHQQVQVQNSGYSYVNIKEQELLEWLEFVFPTGLNTYDNQLLHLQTGQTAGTANDYRLTSGTGNYDLHTKDYKNLTLFPLYETSTSEIKKFNNANGLDIGNADFEWKYKNGSTDEWIKRRYAHEFRNATTNNLNTFEGVVRLFNEVFSTGQTQIRNWIKEVDDTNIDKSSALYALTHGYNLDHSKIVNGTVIIPHGEPNSGDYITKKAEFEDKKAELEEANKDYNYQLTKKRMIKKEMTDIEKRLGKYTKSDKNALLSKLQNVWVRTEAKYDTTTQKWSIKGDRKFDWNFWSGFSTDYEDLLELLGTDETKWENKEKELINTKLKNGTYKYFKEVIEIEYNKGIADFNKYITSKVPSTQTPDKFLEEWIKNKDNAKYAERIVQRLEALKSFVNIEGEFYGDILKKISDSDLIRTDLESALKRVLGTDYKVSIKSAWQKSTYATGDKFWKLVKDFYLKTDQVWKDHVKKEQGVHDNLKDWLKDNDLNIDHFIACIRLFQIQTYVDSTGEQRKEARQKLGNELMNYFVEVDKLNYSYYDIVNSKNTDFTATKAYEELKKNIMGTIDETLGLNKDKDAETITKWVNFKEYSTTAKIEELLKDLQEEVKAEKDGDKPTKKFKQDFLDYISKSNFSDFLKEKSPQEVVATIRRYQLKDIKAETIENKKPEGKGKDFESSKIAIARELEGIKTKLEEIKSVGTLTDEENKILTATMAKLSSLQKLKGEEDEAPKPKAVPKDKDDTKEVVSGDKSQEPKESFFAKHKTWILVGGAVALILAGVAVWYFFFKGKGEKPEEESSEGDINE